MARIIRITRNHIEVMTGRTIDRRPRTGFTEDVSPKDLDSIKGNGS